MVKIKRTCAIISWPIVTYCSCDNMHQILEGKAHNKHFMVLFIPNIARLLPPLRDCFHDVAVLSWTFRFLIIELNKFAAWESDVNRNDAEGMEETADD